MRDIKDLSPINKEGTQKRVQQGQTSDSTMKTKKTAKYDAVKSDGMGLSTSRRLTLSVMEESSSTKHNEMDVEG